MLNPFRLRNPDTVSAPWRRRFRRICGTIILLKVIVLIVLLWLYTEVQRGPTPTDILPAPPTGMSPLPLDEWALVQGTVVQVTPQFAAKRRTTKSHIQWVLGIEIMLTAALLFFFVAMQLRILHARRLRRAGLCPACNYDLRGLAALDPCPECGCSRTAAIT